MSRKALLLVLVCLPAIALCDEAAAAASPDSEAPPAPVEFSSTLRYSPVYEAANWHKAHIFCLENGMQLPVVYNDDDNTNLHKEMTRHKEVKQMWIGANDLAANSKFHWISNGRRLNYSSWDDEQPNGGNGEDCVIMVKGGDWHDYPCYNKYHFVCEKKEGC